jgi:plasmid maintenance system antidote protein VapI
MKTFKELLIELSACSGAREWAGNMPIGEVVEKCHRGDWLLWLAKKVGLSLQELTLAKGYCAKTVIHLMKDQRSIDAVNMAIAFGNGTETLQNLTNSADAADAAAATAAATATATDAYATTAAATATATAAAATTAAATATVATAAYAAAYAAYAAYAAAYAAADAATAATAATAAYAAAYAAYAARTKNQKETADICRKYIGKIIIDNVNKLLAK